MSARSVLPSLVPSRVWFVALLVALCLVTSVQAQNVPRLTGRVVDQANLLTPDQEAALTARLEALERETSRQLVVVTVPDLQGFTVEDFGFRMGEEWRIGDEEADNGAILLVALNERKIRIEVGDGLEPILTDAMSGLIIRETIRPRFQAGDYAGGIEAGVEAITSQLQAPPEVAEQRALEAARVAAGERRSGGGGFDLSFPIVLFVIAAFCVWVATDSRRHGLRGKRYRRRRRGMGPVVIWGPGWGGGWGGGSSWGGGGSSWGGGGGFSGGGFSGGGGSFGGGGASGGW